MCSLMHVKAIGTKKIEILAEITFLGIFGQILPKTPIVPHGFLIYKETKISKFFKNFTIPPLTFLLLNYFKHEKRNLHGCVMCYMFAM